MASKVASDVSGVRFRRETDRQEQISASAYKLIKHRIDLDQRREQQVRKQQAIMTQIVPSQTPF